MATRLRLCAYDAKNRQRAQSGKRQKVGEMLFDLIKTHFASLMRAVTWRFHLRLQSCTRR